MSKITVEIHARVYDDNTGSHVAIGPDGDGLDLCTVSYNEGGNVVSQFTISWPMAKAAAEAIFDLVPTKIGAPA